MTNVLFVCALNLLRSPTAERVFAKRPGITTASAGLISGAERPLTPELLEWADLIFVMDRSLEKRLSSTHGSLLASKRVICLDIPDKYAFMQSSLIRMLKTRVGPHLHSLPGAR